MNESNGELKTQPCLWCRSPINRGQFLYLSNRIDLLKAPAFRPKRWDSDGYPLDEKDERCRVRCCPECTQPLPGSFGKLGGDYRIISVVGQGSSGKSYYLATLIRRLGMRGGNFSINGEDTEVNEILEDMSEVPFKDGDPISRYLDKTFEGSPTYRRILIPRQGGDHEFPVPIPFSYRIGGLKGGHDLRIALYDSQGEAFVSAKRGTLTKEQEIAVGHIVYADLILLLYDPLQDNEIRRRINEQLSQKEKISSAKASDKQGAMIDIMINRIENDLGQIADSSKRKVPPVAVMVGKYDSWRNLKDVVDLNMDTDGIDERGNLRHDVIDENSKILGSFLGGASAPIFGRVSQLTDPHNLRFFAVSSLGHPTVNLKHPRRGEHVNAPSRPAEPIGVEVPFFWGLEKMRIQEGITNQ